MDHGFCVYEESLEEECICYPGRTGQNCTEVTELQVEQKYFYNLTMSCRAFNRFVHEKQGIRL